MNFTISIGKYRFSIINCFAFAGSLFMILAFFSKLPQYNIDFFFSSDCLYLPSVYKDLFLDGNHLKDWSLNPSPNFFPDMALYFALMFICKNSFIVSSFIYAILQYATILGLTIFLFKKILPKQSPHWAALIVLLYTLFLTEYLCFTKEYFYSFYLLSNAYHTGSFVMTLLCFYCSVKYYQTQLYRHMIFILTFGIISVLSDRLFIVLYAIPAFTSGFFLVKRVPLKYIIWHWITIIVLVLLGMTAFTVLGEGNYFKIEKPYNLLAFENISNSFSVFSAQMLDYLSEFGIKSFTVYLFLLSICMLIYLFFKTRKNPNSLLLNYYTVFAIVFSIAVLSAPIVNGNYTGYDTLRYNVYPFYLISLNIPLFLAYTVKKSKLLAIGKQCLNVCCMILLATGIFFTNKEELKKYFTFYPETARVLDELAETQGLLCGVGNYWEAKKVTLFSKKKVRVLAVYDDLAFTEHADNTTWFSTNRFNFILTANFVDTITYKSRVLWLKSIENTANLQILKTNVFTYQKDKSTLPINNSGSE